VKSHLNACGFPNVYNKCEDFYSRIRTKTTPEYDILITNPPYSTKPFDHVERLMDFCQKSGKPYMILQPCYVYCKPYYADSLAHRPTGVKSQPFYITPSTRYTYKTPTGLRDVKAGALSTSPFVTFWFCDGANYRDPLVKWWCETGKDECKGSSFKLTTKSLPRRFKDSHDETRPRLRKKQRDATKRREAKAAGLNPFREMKTRRTRKFNRGDAPHRAKGPR
jgi:hypothetical protein